MPDSVGAVAHVMPGSSVPITRKCAVIATIVTPAQICPEQPTGRGFTPPVAEVAPGEGSRARFYATGG